jgi:hypothetical protein
MWESSERHRADLRIHPTQSSMNSGRGLDAAGHGMDYRYSLKSERTRDLQKRRPRRLEYG